MNITSNSNTLSGRPKWLHYGFIVLGIHVLGLILLIPQIREYPLLLGFSFLAYTLGLRHAFDADHIAAIDNKVRKLIQQNENPCGIGFFFSLGHSSVVFIMAAITAVSMHWAQRNIPQLQAIGGLIGTTVSGVFLILIGIMNLYIWIDLYRFFTEMRKGVHDEKNLDHLLVNRGLISRFFKPLY